MELPKASGPVLPRNSLVRFGTFVPLGRRWRLAVANSDAQEPVVNGEADKA
jgi:hypothetical protein